MTQQLYLIRGLPGSGKTTLAQHMLDAMQGGGYHCEADQFFLQSNGHKEVYNFDRRFLGAAHDECYGKSMRYLREGRNVIVANQFSTARELNRYIDGVKRCGLKVEVTVIRCSGNFKSPHGVPQKVIDKMAERFEDFPGEVMFNGELA